MRTNFLLMGELWTWTLIVNSEIEFMLKKVMFENLFTDFYWLVSAAHSFSEGERNSAVSAFSLFWFHCISYEYLSFFMHFFITNYGQVLSLKVAYIFEVWGSKLNNGCSAVWITVCKKYNNFQDSKSLFMITDFKISPMMLLRQLNSGVFSA